MVYLPPQALPPACSRRSCIALTMVWVWVREEPVRGRLDTILRVAPPPPPAAPQAERARLAITSTESKAKKRLFIFLTPPKYLGEFDFPQIAGTTISGQCLLCRHHLLM